ncbi:MAG: class I SAM-dependent methyltransferase [Candidatus Kariarchaeaceae archaeon]
MDYKFEKKYHRMETRNWWFVTRREIILKFLAKEKKSSNILEIGCSGGLLYSLLVNNGFNSLTGIDISENAINLCKKRGLTNTYVMNGANTEFEDDKFDIIIASDVLEHIHDDKSAIYEWKRILKHDGKLILFVPAFYSLWSNRDVVNHHFRRYGKNELKHLIQSEAFIIENLSFWNFTLFFPVIILNKILKKFNHQSRDNKKDLSDSYSIPSFLNLALLAILRIENWFLSRIKFPTGVSLFAICKPK